MLYKFIFIFLPSFLATLIIFGLTGKIMKQCKFTDIFTEYALVTGAAIYSLLYHVYHCNIFVSMIASIIAIIVFVFAEMLVEVSIGSHDDNE